MTLFVCHLSESLSFVAHCLESHCFLYFVGWYVLFCFLVVLDGKINLVPITATWPEIDGQVIPINSDHPVLHDPVVMLTGFLLLSSLIYFLKNNSSCHEDNRLYVWRDMLRHRECYLIIFSPEYNWNSVLNFFSLNTNGSVKDVDGDIIFQIELSRGGPRLLELHLSITILGMTYIRTSKFELPIRNLSRHGK